MSTLGDKAGAMNPFSSAITRNKNRSFLNTYEHRDSDGAYWGTASTMFEKQIDRTPMGYLKFNGSTNQYGLSLGSLKKDILIVQPFGKNIDPPIFNPIVTIIGNLEISKSLNVSKDINFDGKLSKNGIPIALDEVAASAINDKITKTASTLIGKFGSEEFTGSGNFISLSDDDLEMGLFMTAAHCVITKVNGIINLADEIWITNPITKEYVKIETSYENIVYDGISDIALIKTDIALTSIYVLKIAQESPKIGDICYSISNPLGADSHSFTKGVIRDINWLDQEGYIVPPILLADVAIHSGSSGSVLVNKFGDIISIITFGFNVVDNLNGGANYDVLKKVLFDLKAMLKITPHSQNNIEKFYIGIDIFRTSTFAFYLKNIYGSDTFPNEGVIVYNVNQTYSKFKTHIKTNDIVLGYKVVSENGDISDHIPIGVLPGQSSLGEIMYGSNSKIIITYLDSGDNFTKKDTPATILNNFTGIPLNIDYPLQGNLNNKNSQKMIKLK